MKIEDLGTATALVAKLADIDARLRAAQEPSRLTLSVFAPGRSSLFSGPEHTIEAPQGHKLEAALRAALLADLRDQRSDTEIALIRLGIDDIPPVPAPPQTEAPL
jgi:hypothetical protein